MKSVYYAHPMALYNTSREACDIEILRVLGFKVINPNHPKYRDFDMAAFVKLACTADIVAFRAFDDGKIGSGVALELGAAREADIPIIELPTYLIERYLTRNETRARMGIPPLRKTPLHMGYDYDFMREFDNDDFGDQ